MPMFIPKKDKKPQKLYQEGEFKFHEVPKQKQIPQDELGLQNHLSQLAVKYSEWHLGFQEIDHRPPAEEVDWEQWRASGEVGVEEKIRQFKEGDLAYQQRTQTEIDKLETTIKLSKKQNWDTIHKYMERSEEPNP